MIEVETSANNRRAERVRKPSDGIPLTGEIVQADVDHSLEGFVNAAAFTVRLCSANDPTCWRTRTAMYSIYYTSSYRFTTAAPDRADPSRYAGCNTHHSRWSIVFGVTTCRSSCRCCLATTWTPFTYRSSARSHPSDRTTVRDRPRVGTRSALAPGSCNEQLQRTWNPDDRLSHEECRVVRRLIDGSWSDLTAILPQQDERRRRRYSQPRRWLERHYEPRERPGAPSRHRPGYARPIDACTFLSFMYIPLDLGGWPEHRVGDERGQRRERRWRRRRWLVGTVSRVASV